LSLTRALSNLPEDAELERTLRDVLILFRRHKAEWLSELDVRTKTGCRPAHIAMLLPVLACAFVLDFDSASGAYRFNGDVVLGYEIDAFVRRVDSHQAHVRTNVAKFRERRCGS
jgi:hypothetical protein